MNFTRLFSDKVTPLKFKFKVSGLFSLNFFCRTHSKKEVKVDPLLSKNGLKGLVKNFSLFANLFVKFNTG